MAGDYYEDYPRFESLEVRRKKAAKRVAELTEERGQLHPAVAKGTKIATSFWGQSWNRNLEQYQYYEHRLPRGRSYVKNGLVLDLRVEKGRVSALVSGTELYEVSILIEPLNLELWAEFKELCSGQISSLVGLLKGELSDAVMAAVTDPNIGLFPEPDEIQFICTCPDDADLCKHCAAAAYGVGARLDEQPELLFLLRGVDHHELIGGAATALAADLPEAEDLGGLSELFGIELEEPNPAAASNQEKEQQHEGNSKRKRAAGVGGQLASGGQSSGSRRARGRTKKTS